MTDDTVAPETPLAASTTEPAPKETDWVAEARKWEQRAKDNSARAKANEGAAQRLTELENASKTELQRALDRAETAEKRVAEFETGQQIAAWKTAISTESGVPVQYLRGATEDELKAHADELKPLFDKRGPVVPGAATIPTTAPRDDRDTARRLFAG